MRKVAVNVPTTQHRTEGAKDFENEMSDVKSCLFSCCSLLLFSRLLSDFDLLPAQKQKKNIASERAEVAELSVML